MDRVLIKQVEKSSPIAICDNLVILFTFFIFYFIFLWGGGHKIVWNDSGNKAICLDSIGIWI